MINTWFIFIPCLSIIKFTLHHHIDNRKINKIRIINNKISVRVSYYVTITVNHKSIRYTILSKWFQNFIQPDVTNCNCAYFISSISLERNCHSNNRYTQFPWDIVYNSFIIKCFHKTGRIFCIDLIKHFNSNFIFSKKFLVIDSLRKNYLIFIFCSYCYIKKVFVIWKKQISKQSLLIFCFKLLQHGCCHYINFLDNCSKVRFSFWCNYLGNCQITLFDPYLIILLKKNRSEGYHHRKGSNNNNWYHGYQFRSYF